MSHTGLIRATQDELHGAQVLGLLRELDGCEKTVPLVSCARLVVLGGVT
jgi:hypothetical protein